MTANKAQSIGIKLIIKFTLKLLFDTIMVMFERETLTSYSGTYFDSFEIKDRDKADFFIKFRSIASHFSI